jgi:hypothetical protein
VVEKYFRRYLSGDQTTRQLKKNHRNYKWIVNNVKNIFSSQVKPLTELLKCEEENDLNGNKINTYDDLAIATFKNREKTKEALEAQFYLLNDGLKKIEEDPSIINIVTGQEILVNVLRNGFQDTWDELVEDVNNLKFKNDLQ